MPGPWVRTDHPAAPPLAPTIGSHGRLVQALEVLLDPLVAALSLWMVAWWIDNRMTAAWLLVSVLAFALAYPGRLRLYASPTLAAATTLGNWAWVIGVLGVAYLVTGPWPALSGPVLWHWLWLAPMMQLAAHAGLRACAPLLVRLQGPPLRAVVVGLNEQGRMLFHRLMASHDAGIELVGCFDDRKRARGNAQAAPGASDVPAPGSHRASLLDHPRGRLADVAGFVKAHRVQRVYLCLPMASQPRIRALLQELEDTTASVFFVPDLFVTDLVQGHADTVCGLPVISVCDTPFRGPAGLVKRVSDLVLATLILVLMAPVMLAVALAVWLDSPGPILFRQRRYGLDGKAIIVYKFRSMTVAEDGPLVRQAQRGDARITRVGAFLRRTSLDELPQLINVLQGRMSVVGPRPHAVAHNEFYRHQIRRYMLRHKVRPGITGWAQVNGLRGETDSLQKMADRIQYDLDYLRHWSLWLDLYIVLRTVKVVAGDRQAY